MDKKNWNHRLLVGFSFAVKAGLQKKPNQWFSPNNSRWWRARVKPKELGDLRKAPRQYSVGCISTRSGRNITCPVISPATQQLFGKLLTRTFLLYEWRGNHPSMHFPNCSSSLGLLEGWNLSQVPQGGRSFVLNKTNYLLKIKIQKL